MGTIHAIYENGVFRPTEPITLPEHSQVEFEPRLVIPREVPTLQDVYAILAKRYESGESATAERHNEHQHCDLTR